MSEQELYLLILSGTGIIFWGLTIWLNIDTWDMYKDACMKVDEQRRLMEQIERLQSVETRILTSKILRKPPRVLSPEQQKQMAKVIKFNSAKELKKLLNKTGRGDNQ